MRRPDTAARAILQQSIRGNRYVIVGWDRIDPLVRKEEGRKTIPSHRSPSAAGAADPETEFRLGISLQREGKFREAKIHYERVLALRPDLAVVHCNLGVVLHNLGDLAGAVAHQEQALGLRPDLAEAHNNLGLVFRQ